MSVSLVRGSLTGFSERRFSASGRAGETFSNRRSIQHFGLVSSPLPGAEGLIVKQGENVWLIGTSDSRYEIPVNAGDTAIYNSSGSFVKLEAGNAEMKAQKVFIGNATIELLDQIVQLIGALINSVVPTVSGPQKLSEVAVNFPIIKAKLELLKK